MVGTCKKGIARLSVLRNGHFSYVFIVKRLTVWQAINGSLQDVNGNRYAELGELLDV